MDPPSCAEKIKNTGLKTGHYKKRKRQRFNAEDTEQAENAERKRETRVARTT